MEVEPVSFIGRAYWKARSFRIASCTGPNSCPDYVPTYLRSAQYDISIYLGAYSICVGDVSIKVGEFEGLGTARIVVFLQAGMHLNVVKSVDAHLRIFTHCPRSSLCMRAQERRPKGTIICIHG